MAKRENESCETDEQACSNSKKPKHSTSVSSLQRISTDELGQVMNFLTNKEMIKFAITSAINYQFVKDYIQQNYPLAVEHVGLAWTLEKVLKIHDCIEITGDAKLFRSVFTKIADHHGGNLNALTRKVEFNYIRSTRVFETLFSIPIRESVQFQSMKIPHVLLEPNSGNTYSIEGESTDSETRTIEEKVIPQIPLGYMLKRLKLCIQNDVKDMYTILEYCQALETLEVSIGDSVFNSEEFENGSIYCPLLISLKSLKIGTHAILGKMPSQKHIIDLLKLTPNLEKLDIFFHNYCDVNIYRYIAKMCPKIRHLCVVLDQGYGILETTITDNELYSVMKSLPYLEYVRITKASEISGEIFSKIGEFTQLRHFEVIRGCYDQDIHQLVPQADVIHFGGGVLPHLTYLYVGQDFQLSKKKRASLLESLQKMAPNLKLQDVGF